MYSESTSAARLTPVATIIEPTAWLGYKAICQMKKHINSNCMTTKWNGKVSTPFLPPSFPVFPASSLFHVLFPPLTPLFQSRGLPGVIAFQNTHKNFLLRSSHTTPPPVTSRKGKTHSKSVSPTGLPSAVVPVVFNTLISLSLLLNIKATVQKCPHSNDFKQVFPGHEAFLATEHALQGPHTLLLHLQSCRRPQVSFNRPFITKPCWVRWVIELK